MNNRSLISCVLSFVRNPKLSQWLSHLFSIALILGLLLSAVGVAVQPAYAQEGDPGDPIGDDGVNRILAMFKKLGDMFIKIAYSLMVILFAVGTVKSGLAAQAAQQFGASGRVSLEFMNLAVGAVIFIVGLLSMPLVLWILSEIGSLIDPSDLKIQAPSNFPIPLPDDSGAGDPTAWIRSLGI